MEGSEPSSLGTTRARVSYNFSTRLVGRGAGAVITLVALRLTTHYFGPARWGAVVAASAFANLFVGLCDFGVTRIISREMAAKESDESAVYGAGLIAGMLVSVASMAVMTAGALLVYIHRPDLRSLCLILVLSLPPNAFWLISGAVLIAKARNDVRGVIDAASSIFLLAAAGSTVAAALAASGYLWLTVLADAVTAVLGLALARRHVRADFRSGARRTRDILSKAAAIGTSQALYSIAVQTDVVLLSLFVSTSRLGEFGVAFQVAIFGAALPPILTAAILPKFVDAPPDRQLRLVQRAFDALILAAAAVPLLALLFGKGVIIAIAGRSFIGGTTPLILLSCFTALAFPATLFLDGLVYVRTEKAVLGTIAIGAVANLGAAAIVIPLFGADAAALVMTGGNAAILASGAVLFRRASGLRISLRRGISFVAVATLLAGACAALHFSERIDASTGWLMVPEAAAVIVAYLGLSSAVGMTSLLREGGDHIVGH
jgi:O-antigen/teichoic acid export membrane protein